MSTKINTLGTNLSQILLEQILVYMVNMDQISCCFVQGKKTPCINMRPLIYLTSCSTAVL